MLASGHMAAAAAAWLTVAPHLHTTGWQTAAGTAIAAAFSHGHLSPDMDLMPITEAVIPGGHRAITHWPVLVAALTVAAVVLTPPGWRWAATAACVAWGSHLLVDAVFGRIPIWPRPGGWTRAGVGLHTGGLVEHLATPALAVAAVALAALQIRNTIRPN